MRRKVKEPFRGLSSRGGSDDDGIAAVATTGAGIDFSWGTGGGPELGGSVAAAGTGGTVVLAALRRSAIRSAGIHSGNPWLHTRVEGPSFPCPAKALSSRIETGPSRSLFSDA